MICDSGLLFGPPCTCSRWYSYCHAATNHFVRIISFYVLSQLLLICYCAISLLLSLSVRYTVTIIHVNVYFCVFARIHTTTYKTLNTSAPRYLSRRVNARTLRTTATPLLIQPFVRTDFAKRSFRCAAHRRRCH